MQVLDLDQSQSQHITLLLQPVRVGCIPDTKIDAGWTCWLSCMSEWHARKRTQMAKSWAASNVISTAAAIKHQNHVLELVQNRHHPIYAHVEAHHCCVEQKHFLISSIGHTCSIILSIWRQADHKPCWYLMTITSETALAPERTKPKHIEVLRNFCGLDLFGLIWFQWNA